VTVLAEYYKSGNVNDRQVITCDHRLDGQAGCEQGSVNMNQVALDIVGAGARTDIDICGETDWWGGYEVVDISYRSWFRDTNGISWILVKTPEMRIDLEESFTHFSDVRESEMEQGPCIDTPVGCGGTPGSPTNLPQVEPCPGKEVVTVDVGTANLHVWVGEPGVSPDSCP
jgi:hypothetical protein